MSKLSLRAASTSECERWKFIHFKFVNCDSWGRDAFETRKVIGICCCCSPSHSPHPFSPSPVLSFAVDILTTKPFAEREVIYGRPQKLYPFALVPPPERRYARSRNKNNIVTRNCQLGEGNGLTSNKNTARIVWPITALRAPFTPSRKGKHFAFLLWKENDSIFSHRNKWWWRPWTFARCNVKEVWFTDLSMWSIFIH